MFKAENNLYRDDSYNPIIGLPADFTVIDFETANRYRCSPCSVGVTVIKNGEIARSFERLIRPHKDYFYFEDRNISIHGITAEMVENAPEFNVVKEEITPLIENNILAAHNMVFDCAVLCRTLKLYGIANPTCKTICSYNIAKIIYPDLISYRLNMLCKQFEICLNHHNANSDAEACAKLITDASKSEEAKARLAKTQYSYGYINQYDSWSPQYLRKYNKHQTEHQKQHLDGVKKRVCESGAFNDCDVVFTGTLNSMDRKAACKVVELAGGRASNNINKKTEYLVMGIQDFSKFADGEKSTKTKKAEKLLAEGYPIEIISEDDFLRMVDLTTEIA